MKEKSKLIINKISQEKKDYGIDVQFDLSIEYSDHVKDYTLNYEVFNKDVTFVPERCDAPVLMLLWQAIVYNMDIESRYPMSKKLYYNIFYNILPQLRNSNPDKTYDIKIDVPLTAEKYNGTFRGTGVSLGVDSFSTIREYTDDCPFDDYRITHLVHLKTGAHHGQLGYFDAESEEKLFSAENARVSEFCKQHGYNLLTVKTNLYEICCTEWEYSFDTSHILRNLGVILLLQNYFDKYYYASTHNLLEFSVNVFSDMAYYEKWLIPLLTTENTEFVSANKAMSRIDKTKYISNFAPSYDYLHVCWRSDTNCGKCSKCIRTIVALDIMEALDRYKNVFDIPAYKKGKQAILRTLVDQKNEDPYFEEVFRYSKNEGFKMPNRVIAQVSKFDRLAEAIKKHGFKKVIRILKGICGRVLRGKDAY